MMDPIIVAEAIAYTPIDQFVPVANIISNTIGGLQTRGTYRTGMPGL